MTERASSVLYNLKRISFDVVALVSIILAVIFVPASYLPVISKEGLLNLILTKFILVSASVCHAHITRELLFPYIKFREEKDWSNNVMIIAIYVIIIWAWARGG